MGRPSLVASGSVRAPAVPRRQGAHSRLDTDRSSGRCRMGQVPRRRLAGDEGSLGRSRGRRSRPAGRCPGAWAALISGSVPAGGAHRRQCPSLPGAARRDRRRGTEREGRGLAGAEGALVGDPRSCGRAVDGDAGVPGGGVSVGPPRLQGDDRIGRPAVRHWRRSRRSRRLGPAPSGSDTHRVGFPPPAVPGRHL